MDLYGRRGERNGVEGEESVIRIYVRKKSISNKRGEENKTQGQWWEAWPQRSWGSGGHTLYSSLPLAFSISVPEIWSVSDFR